MPAPPPHPQDDFRRYVEDFRRAGHDTIDWAADYLLTVRDLPVVPRVKPGELTDALPASAPDHPEAFAAMLDDFRRLVLPAVNHWNHPGFMAYFACSGSTPAILGETIAAALNTNGLHWKTSPALVELEQVTLDWLRQWMGLPVGYFGLIYDTASLSSFHALAAAREMVAPDARANGNPAGLVAYTSEQSHSSIDRAGIALGIGLKNVRKIPVDAEFRMRPDALAAAIARDRDAGLTPFCIVATAGTTATTSVDPIAALADIAEQHGLWLHVDAAYGGAAAILPELRPMFAGLERADSIVVNAHKWLLTPIDCSCFYTRRPDILRRAFSLVPEYLRTQEDPRAVNLMDYSLSLGRRFRALKLWFVMRYFGRTGMERVLRAHMQWAKDLATLIGKDARFEVSAPVPFSVVCFRFLGADAENLAILERVNASGKTYLSHAVLGGRTVLRMAIGNVGTTWEDVNEAWGLVRAAAPGKS